MVRKMNSGQLLDGTKIDGPFSMLIGAVANPYLKPLELNIIRLAKKVGAGADFIQTQAVFDIVAFQTWFEAARAEGIEDKTAILAGVLPLQNAEEARKLRETHTDFVIPDALVERLTRAGNAGAQKKEGLAICAEMVNRLHAMPGLRGVHILSAGVNSQAAEVLGAVWGR
jgi:methylenetetrahydrofolate reductase (NADPH)